MKKFLKSVFMVPIYMSLLLYFTIFLSMGLIGLCDSIAKKCDDSFNRIEYILPSYEFGCWLGTEVK